MQTRILFGGSQDFMELRDNRFFDPVWSFRRLGVWFLVLVAIGILPSTIQAQVAPKADPEKPKVEQPKKGIQVDGERAQQGYTLVAPLMSNKTFLIDMKGRVVKTWESVSSGASTAYLLENGNLLRHARVNQQLFGDGAGACGLIQEFNWEGEVVWEFKLATTKQMTHHDICKMPNGNVLMVVWEKKTPQEAIEAGRRAETVGTSILLPDCIFEVKPEGKTGGKVVWEWRVWDHLIQDHDKTKANYGEVGDHPELVDLNFGDGVLASIVAKKEELEKLQAIGYIGTTNPGSKPGPVKADWLHVNSVTYNAELNQIMISSPEFNEFWILDHSTSTAEAATHKGGRSGKGGDLLYRWGNPRAYRSGSVKDQKLFYQHMPQWIPKGLPGEGHVLVFNNGQRRPGGAYSSVDELVLPIDSEGNYSLKPKSAYGPDNPVWSYSATKKSDFFAPFISGAHRLPNGNTFICTGPPGNLFEVTPEKEVVWRYINPAKAEPPPTPIGPPSVIVVLPAVLRESLEIKEEQTKALDTLLKDTEAKVDTILTDEQKKMLKEPPKGPAIGPGAATLQAVQVLPGPVRQRLKLKDEQKKKLDDLQKETEGKLDQALTAEQRKQLKEITSNFVNAWGMGGGGPPPLGNALFRSYRYPKEFPGFSGKEMKAGKTIEEMQTKEPEKKEPETKK
jgi:Arylsulfotransferase (ASST)